MTSKASICKCEASWRMTWSPPCWLSEKCPYWLSSRPSSPGHTKNELRHWSRGACTIDKTTQRIFPWIQPAAAAAELVKETARTCRERERGHTKLLRSIQNASNSFTQQQQDTNTLSTFTSNFQQSFLRKQCVTKIIEQHLSGQWISFFWNNFSPRFWAAWLRLIVHYLKRCCRIPRNVFHDFAGFFNSEQSEWESVVVWSCQVIVLPVSSKMVRTSLDEKRVYSCFHWLWDVEMAGCWCDQDSSSRR